MHPSRIKTISQLLDEYTIALNKLRMADLNHSPQADRLVDQASDLREAVCEALDERLTPLTRDLIVLAADLAVENCAIFQAVDMEEESPVQELNIKRALAKAELARLFCEDVEVKL